MFDTFGEKKLDQSSLMNTGQVEKVFKDKKKNLFLNTYLKQLKGIWYKLKKNLNYAPNVIWFKTN